MTSQRSIATRCAAIAAAVFLTSTMAFAQPNAGGGGPGAGGPPMGRMQMQQPGQVLGSFINTLGDLNLRPDFTLTADQKTKIDAVREAFKTSEKAWHEKNAEAIKKLDDEMNDLRQQGPDMDRDAMRGVMDERRELYATAPTGQEQVDEIKKILTPEELKRVETRMDEVRKEREQNGPPGGGRGQGGGQGGGPGGAGGGRGGPGGGAGGPPPAN